jgi:hypothetical protein
MRMTQQLHHYVRQLRDWKTSIIIEDLAPNEMNTYAELCGWTLARGTRTLEATHRYRQLPRRR